MWQSLLILLYQIEVFNQQIYLFCHKPQASRVHTYLGIPFGAGFGFQLLGNASKPFPDTRNMKRVTRKPITKQEYTSNALGSRQKAL